MATLDTTFAQRIIESSVFSIAQDGPPAPPFCSWLSFSQHYRVLFLQSPFHDCDRSLLAIHHTATAILPPAHDRIVRRSSRLPIALISTAVAPAHPFLRFRSLVFFLRKPPFLLQIVPFSVRPQLH